MDIVRSLGLTPVDIWKRISDKRTKNQAKTDKTEHGMEERQKVKVKVNPEKSTAKTEEILNGPTHKGLMVEIKDLGDKANLMAEITLGFYITQETQAAQSLSEQAQRRGPRP
ncbi:hypothetical protein Tco_0127798 [Tanacetum coccineum]